MKLCKTCGNKKSELEFGKRAASNDGLSPKCKECASDYDKKRAMLEHRVKARLDYSKTAQGRLKGSEAKKRWTENNAIKRGASTIVGNAIRDGRLEKQYSCSACGVENVRIHGHHDDYAKPLEVRWLCSACHSEWHNINGEGLNG